MSGSDQESLFHELTLLTMITMNTFEVLNPQGLADECGLTIARIHQLIRAGTIRATRLGKWTYVISRQEAERFKHELVERRASRGVIRPIDFVA